MNEVEQRLSASSDIEDPLSHLASSFLIARGSKEQLSKERLADLIGRAKLGDIEGLASEAHLSSTEALRLAKSLSLVDLRRDGQPTSSRITRSPQTAAATTTRQLLRTPDARRLAKELLAIFANEASSKFASNRFLYLISPTFDENELQSRFEICLVGKSVFEELQTRGKLAEARKLLSTLSLSREKQGSNEGEPKKGSISKESDVLHYFKSRRMMIEIADSFLADFSVIKELASFLLADEQNEGVGSSSGKTSNGRTKDALRHILRSLKEADEFGVPDADGVISDAEIAINDQLQSRRKSASSLDRESVRQLIENRVVQISSTLGMNQQEEDDFMKAVFEGLASSLSSSSSFGFDRRRLREVLDGWRERRVEELGRRLAKVEGSLRGSIKETECVLERLVLLDQMLTISSLIQKYSLVIPKIRERKDTAISFKRGLNLFLLKEGGEEPNEVEKNVAKQESSAVKPVSYSIGAISSKKAGAAEAEDAPILSRNVVMLTGANSGGKTTLLTTLASIHILSLYGLPVPCESADISPMPIYLFRRRMTKKIGSLEQALRSLIPVFADSKERKLVLIDEFEALTEPGAAGRIIAAMLNRAAIGNSLVLLVTHLARETLPHVKLPIRVDGIEASGFDPKTDELIVDRQPKFNHIGSSAPQHVVLKLSKLGSRKSGVRELYQEMLKGLESESSMPVQTPLFLPWIAGVNDKEKLQESSTK
ncbi:MAG: hypothetical protein ACREBS_02000 [Nitrososphaerales archaeon]